MSSLEPPPDDLWIGRYEWLRAIEARIAHPQGSYLLSSQGAFVSFDLEIAFCAGAWVSVIILSHAAIDATIRDTESLDYRANSKILFAGDPDLEWLRKRRNSLVHVREDYDTKQFDMMESYHPKFEADARRAIELVFRIIFGSPGT
jgi:hypothetical protein